MNLPLPESTVAPLESAPERGSSLRLRRGAYVDQGSWAGLRRDQQLLVKVRAIDRAARGQKVFSHHSAAVIWQLPVLGYWPDLVEHSTGPQVKGRAPGARRRRTDVPVLPVEHDGLLVTSVARTVIDLAREQPLSWVLSAADAALRHGLCQRADLQAELDRLPSGFRGRRRAGLVVRLTDGRAESPGESLSRAQMYLYGVNRPELQVEVRDAVGVLLGRSDFGWGVVLGEFDGAVKYRTGAAGLAPTSAEDAVIAEKVREDRIRATGAGVARWVWADAWQGDPMVSLLRRAGVPFGDPWF